MSQVDNMTTLTLPPQALAQSELHLDWEACNRVANRMRYWVHAQYGEDFVQDVLVEMMERARRNGGGLSAKEMWQAARCVRNRYWRAYSRGKKPLSLNAPIPGTEEPIELWETLPDKGSDLNAWLDAKMRLEELPPGILRIAKKLEKGDPLTQDQQAYLDRFRKDGKPSAQRAWEMNRYRRLRAEGRCVRCGQRADDGFARCARCRERHRFYQRKHKRNKGKNWQCHLRQHWRRKGLCCRCGHPPEPGYKLCPRCRQKNKEYLRRYREKRPGLRQE